MQFLFSSFVSRDKAFQKIEEVWRANVGTQLLEHTKPNDSATSVPPSAALSSIPVSADRSLSLPSRASTVAPLSDRSTSVEPTIESHEVRNAYKFQ